MSNTDKIIEDRIQNVIIPREVARYMVHNDIYLNRVPGKATDAAYAKMEAICLRAEKGGYIEDLLEAIKAVRGY